MDMVWMQECDRSDFYGLHDDTGLKALIGPQRPDQHASIREKQATF